MNKIFPWQPKILYDLSFDVFQIISGMTRFRSGIHLIYPFNIFNFIYIYKLLVILRSRVMVIPWAIMTFNIYF